MEASPQFEALVPQPLDAEGIERRRELEDIHEELLLSILALEEEWQLDKRIAFSLRPRKAARGVCAGPNHRAFFPPAPTGAAACPPFLPLSPSRRTLSCAYRRACRTSRRPWHRLPAPRAAFRA